MDLGRNFAGVAGAAVVVAASTLTIPASEVNAGPVGYFEWNGIVDAVGGASFDEADPRPGDAFSFLMTVSNNGVFNDSNPDPRVSAYNLDSSQVTYQLVIGDNEANAGGFNIGILDDFAGDYNEFSGNIFSIDDSDSLFNNSQLVFSTFMSGPEGGPIFSSDGWLDALGADGPGDDPANFDLFPISQFAFSVNRAGSFIRMDVDGFSYTPVPPPGTLALLAVGGALASRSRGSRDPALAQDLDTPAPGA